MHPDQRSSSDVVDVDLARINTALGTWKARMRQALRSPSDPPADTAEARAELLRATEELKSDLAAILETLQAEVARADVLEATAIAAVHRGDDPGARAALLDHEAVIARLKQLEAEANVIRAMVAECAVVLAGSAV
jgi:hypothetical protein